MRIGLLVTIAFSLMFSNASTAEAGVRSFFKKIFKKEEDSSLYEYFANSKYRIYSYGMEERPNYFERLSEAHNHTEVMRAGEGIERHSFTFNRPIFAHRYITGEQIYLRLSIRPFWHYAINLNEVFCVIEAEGEETQTIPISQEDYRIIPGDTVDVSIKYIIPQFTKDSDITISVLYKKNKFNKITERVRMVLKHEEDDIEIVSPTDYKKEDLRYGFCRCGDEEDGETGDFWNKALSYEQEQILKVPTSKTHPEILSLDSYPRNLEISITPGAYLEPQILKISHPSFCAENILDGHRIFKLNGTGTFVSNVDQSMAVMPEIIRYLNHAEGPNDIFLKIPAGIYGDSSGHKIVYP